MLFFSPHAIIKAPVDRDVHKINHVNRASQNTKLTIDIVCYKQSSGVFHI